MKSSDILGQCRPCFCDYSFSIKQPKPGQHIILCQSDSLWILFAYNPLRACACEVSQQTVSVSELELYVPDICSLSSTLHFGWCLDMTQSSCFCYKKESLQKQERPLPPKKK